MINIIDIYGKPIFNISIDTTNHILSLYKNNEIYSTYPVAVGKKSTSTPKGSFTIVDKILNPGGPYGARWLGLSINHYGIHGTNNPDSIGKNVSNGCIRLQNKDIIGFYDYIEIGTAVKII